MLKITYWAYHGNCSGGHDHVLAFETNPGPPRLFPIGVFGHNTKPKC